MGGCPEWARRYSVVCNILDNLGAVATGAFGVDIVKNVYNYMASNACSIAAAHGSFCGGAAGGGGSDTGSGGASKLF